MLSFSQVEIDARHKSLPKIFNMMEVILPWRLFILSIRKAILRGKKEFSHTVFVELFMAHLLEKNSRFYHLPKPRYIQNKKMFQHYGNCAVRKKVIFFLLQFLQFKLHLMSNVNIPKDAARSELSRYVLII
jgi:hypothetical protein